MGPRQTLGAVTVLVRDYDEAKAWFLDVLGFRCVADEPLSPDKRWLLVEPPGGTGTRLLLARAADAREAARIGDQTGGRVFLFLHTEDFWRDHAALQARGVRFQEQPRREDYGTVAVFADLYGNLWDLLQPAG